MSYNLIQKDILTLMREGDGENRPVDIFVEVISKEIDEIAGNFGVTAHVSKEKLIQAWEVWDSDLMELNIRESEEPCHFKHAGWLCHWLRRKQPIYKLEPLLPHRRQDIFDDHHNEVIALTIGLRVATYYECCRHNLPKGSISASMRKVIDREYYTDFVNYLSHKSVSPHAIFLSLRSIFAQPPLVWATEGPVAVE